MYVISETSEVANTLILIDIIHGHATLRKKKTYQIFTRNSPTTDFRATFLYNRRCLTSEIITRRKQSNFYWERRLGLFWKLHKESITKLLVSLVHQFIWPCFTLAFRRNGIFKYSQKRPYHKPVSAVTSKRGRSSISGKNPSSRFGRIIPFRKTKKLNCRCACR